MKSMAHQPGPTLPTLHQQTQQHASTQQFVHPTPPVTPMPTPLQLSQVNQQLPPPPPPIPRQASVSGYHRSYANHPYHSSYASQLPPAPPSPAPQQQPPSYGLQDPSNPQSPGPYSIPMGMYGDVLYTYPYASSPAHHPMQPPSTQLLPHSSVPFNSALPTSQQSVIPPSSSSSAAPVTSTSPAAYYLPDSATNAVLPSTLPASSLPSAGATTHYANSGDPAPPSTTNVNTSSVMDSDLDLMLGPRKRNQVKRACVNCQKACKKCDNGRPCSRCIKFGLEKTCADSARKERSRSNLVGPFRKNLDGISTAHGYSSLSSPRSGSIDSQEDGESSGWSKLDILSRLCSTVLIHAHEIGRPRSAEPPSVPEPSPDDTPEVHAARTLSILASKARAQERSPELDMVTPVTPVESDEFAKPFEYDHKSFDHKQLVHELGKTGSFGNLTIEQLATGVFGAFPYLSYGSLYPFDILTAAAGGGSNGSAAMHYSNGSNAINPSGLNSPYDLGSATLAATSTPGATPGAREPNPLDDFAAISDTVRRMEDEASARSKRRRTNTTSVNLPNVGGLSSTSISALNVANMTSSLVSATSQGQALDLKTFAPPLGYSAPGAYPSTQVSYHRVLGAGDHRSSPSRIYSPPTPPEFCMPGETGLLGEERK